MNSEKRGPLQPHPRELKERGYQLYEQGKSNREIAKELGIPLNTLARWSSKGRWKLRKQLASHAEAGLGALAPAVQDEISKLSFEEKQARYAQMMADHALRAAYAVRSLSPQGLVVNADKIKKLDETARKALNLEENKPAVVVNVGLLHELFERRRAKLVSRDTGRLESKHLQIAEAVEVTDQRGASDSEASAND